MCAFFCSGLNGERGKMMFVTLSCRHSWGNHATESKHNDDDNHYDDDGYVDVGCLHLRYTMLICTHSHAQKNKCITNNKTEIVHYANTHWNLQNEIQMHPKKQQHEQRETNKQTMLSLSLTLHASSLSSLTSSVCVFFVPPTNHHLRLKIVSRITSFNLL